MSDDRNGATMLDSEVPARAVRRRFTPEYKQRILVEAGRCAGSGDIGALLRREGLYSSHLTSWRKAERKGALAELSKKRGRTTKETAETKELKRLQRENERLRLKLRRAETVIEVQKKVSEMLGTDLNPPESGEDD